MGGVRNREEKKKAAHVFSSGGGGGTKGPAVVDKRNVELECPHCDRTFKQIQRFKEHVQKKHADVAEVEGSASAEPVPASAATPSAKPQAKTMDLGAKAGFYTEKSPKMLLHEWCMQKKRPTPRYRITAAEEGEQITKSKVVLADPKDREKDVVVFLASEHQCSSQEETGQRVAVTALHKIAGDRALHRVLPEMYRALWDNLGEHAVQKAEVQARTAAATEARQVREKARRMSQARRAPKDVVMSEAQRRMVQSILREQGHDIGASSSATTAFETEEGALGEVMAQLRNLGFGDSDAQDAVAITVAEGGHPSLESALDWLCLHVPETNLPARFAAGVSGVPFQILHAANGKDMGKHQKILDPDLAYLMDLGYGQEITITALTEAMGNVSQAFQHLFEDLTGSSGVSSDSSANHEVSADVWSEEREALQAIYGEDMQILGPSQTLLSVDVHGTHFFLDFRIHHHLHYPSQPPLIGVRCSDIKSQTRLQLARLLFEQGRQLEGSPMLFELATALPDLLATASRAVVEQLRLSPCLGLSQPQGADSEHISVPDSRIEQQARRGQMRQQQQHQMVDVVVESAMLQERWKAWQSSSAEVRMRGTRSALPARERRAAFLHALQCSNVIVIQGATGSGKSTQMPQYILEEAVERGQGGACNILVTQPRRISAVGVAARVAQERAERIGDVVGYSVRLESRRSAHTRLLFCTTGVVLRRLLSDPTLEGITHVVVDEVHERSSDSDLLLLLLRDLLSSGSKPSLRIILMSATAEADAFMQYFEAALPKGKQRTSSSIVNIPGFTHPIEDLYLEDVLEQTGFQIGRGSKWAKKGRPEAESKVPNPAALPPPRVSAPGAAHTSVAQLQSEQEYSQATERSLQNVDESLINYELLEALVSYIVSSQQSASSEANAILIFMPGAPEISRLVRTLQGSSLLQRAAHGQSCRILPCHGSLPPDQQAKVFDRVKPGQRKIVVATNVAETSITIDDVVCVIDCGRVKEIRYDSERGIARLQEGWVSLASAKQRRGRAGRVRPGICYKMFSRRQANTMEAHQLPEVLRMPLESLCLSVKACLPHIASLQEALARLLSPPTQQAVAAAVQSLKVLGALDTEEILTPLGQHLCKMPMDIRLAKTLIYASMLRCISPVLTIIAAMAWGKPVFNSPPDRREEANAARKQLAADSAAARSDHLLMVAAFSAWDTARRNQGRQAAFQVASQMFLSDAAMEATLNGRAEYARVLADLGFVSPDYAISCNTLDVPEDIYGQDAMSGNARVIKAAICAGFYPSILRIEHPPRVYKKVLGGAMESDASPARLKFFDRTKGRVFIHPASVNFDCGEFPSGWMVYSDITETSKVYVREASMVPVYALLLFGGKLTVHHMDGLIKLDNWATFKAPAQIATLVDGLRKEVEQLLLRKIADPDMVLGQNRVVEAMLGLLSHDGF